VYISFEPDGKYAATGLVYTCCYQGPHPPIIELRTILFDA